MKDFRCYFLQLLHANNYNITKIDIRVLHSSGKSFWSSSKDEKEKKKLIVIKKNYNLYEDLLVPINKISTYVSYRQKNQFHALLVL